MENSVTLLFGRERRSPSEFDYGSPLWYRREIRLNQIALDVGEGARKKMGEYFRQFLDAINE